MADIWMDVDAALSEVPVNLMPLLDDTDFKSKEESVVYNQTGLDLVWNFVTTAGAFTQTAVTPTESAGNYDWSNQGNGYYAIEIPASGGASINNDTEGFGWFSGVATGILPWRGPVIGFRASGTNDKLIDSAYSATRGLAGTALPDAAADAAGGLPISDAGGLDLDDLKADINTIDDFLDTEIAAILAAVDTEVAAILADTGELQTDWADGGRLDLLIDAIKTVTDALGSTAAANLALSAAGIVSGEAAAGTLSTTEMTTDLTEATDDHYIGRIVVWTSGALAGQASDITDYTGATKKLTYSTVTDAPSAADTFVIL